MDNKVVIDSYTKMDKVVDEERRYILNMCSTIKKTGCNVLLIQKSILRDAVSDLSLSFLAKMGILVVKDIEREDIEFISKVSFPCCYTVSSLLTSMALDHQCSPHCLH